MLILLPRLHSWPCPRCGYRFLGVGVNFLRDKCACCGLQAFASTAEVNGPVEGLDPRGWTLAPRLRRAIAGAQILGGVAVGGLAIAYGGGLMVTGMVSAAVLGGAWLWLDRSSGYSLTRLLLALQVIQFAVPGVVYALNLGWRLEFVRRAGVFNMSAGMNARFLLAGYEGPWEVAINVYALLAALMLAGARPTAAFKVKDSEAGANAA